MSALLGRIAAAASAVGFALCPGPLPAYATSDLRLHLQTVTVAPGSERKLIPIWATVPASGVHPVRFTVDYSGVAGFATVSPAEVDYIIAGTGAGPSAYPDSPCTSGAGRFTCEYERSLSDRLPQPIGTLAISPKRRDGTGTSGTLRITATVDGWARTVTSTVRVGEAVDLRAMQTGSISAPAGGAANTDLRVRNLGATTVDGVVLRLGADPRLLAPVPYRNCSVDETGLVCVFDTPLAPGTTYAPSEPLALRPPADSVTGSRMLAAAHWMTATEWADLRSAFGADPAGSPPASGPTLTLAEVTTAAGPQADVDDTDNWTEVVLDVTGGRQADIVALGATGTAAVSDRTTVRIGLLNRGPGRLRPDLYVNNRVDVTVRIPPGTRIMRLPSACLETNDRVFRCWTTAELKPGVRHFHEVTLRVTKAGRSAGRVEVIPVDAELPPLADPHPADNSAPLVITGTGGAESLPITGAGGVAALGSSLLVLGGISRLVARRRAGPAG